MGYYLDKLKEGADPIIVTNAAEVRIKELENTINATIVYAFRYALGSNSYSVPIMCEEISKLKLTIPQRTLGVIKKSIQDYLDNSPEGFTTEWRDLLKELNGDTKSYSASTLEVPK